MTIEPCALPEAALLCRYAEAGAYTDCYATNVAGAVSLAQYVAAFYTTPLFKLERVILKLALNKPSTDAQAGRLTDGSIDSFAAWRVEDRSENQLLMCDVFGGTRSWLMVAPVPTEEGVGTRLYFGSAVVPKPNPKTGERRMAFNFRLLLGFHKLYSVALLRAAVSRLKAQLS